MPERDWREIYRDEALTLGRIGEVLVHADMPKVEVRLPRELADAAVEAWERDDDVSDTGREETCEERVARSRAASLSLIGLSITERGRWDGDEMVVTLSPVFTATPSRQPTIYRPRATELRIRQSLKQRAGVADCRSSRGAQASIGCAR